MKKVIIIIFSIVLVLTALLFLFGNFSKRQVGIGYEYYNSLSFNLDNYTVIDDDLAGKYICLEYVFKGSKYTLFYSHSDGVETQGYLRHNYISKGVRRGMFGGVGLPSDDDISVIVNLDEETKTPISIYIPINAKYLLQSINTNVDAFQGGLNDFNLWEDTSNNLLTWFIDMIVELYNMIVGLFADFGGAFLF